MMSPFMVHRIAQEIRQFRAFLSSHEKWLQSQDRVPLVFDEFQRVNFWRRTLKHAEAELTRESVNRQGSEPVPDDVMKASSAAVSRSRPHVRENDDGTSRYQGTVQAR